MSYGEPPRPPPHGGYKGKGIAHTNKRKYLLRVSPQHLFETSTAPTTYVGPTQSTVVGPIQSTDATISATRTPIPTFAVNIDTPSTSAGNLRTPVQQPHNDVSSPSDAAGDSVTNDIDLYNRLFIEPYDRG